MEIAITMILWGIVIAIAIIYSFNDEIQRLKRSRDRLDDELRGLNKRDLKTRQDIYSLASAMGYHWVERTTAMWEKKKDK